MTNIARLAAAGLTLLPLAILAGATRSEAQSVDETAAYLLFGNDFRKIHDRSGLKVGRIEMNDPDRTVLEIDLKRVGSCRFEAGVLRTEGSSNNSQRLSLRFNFDDLTEARLDERGRAVLTGEEGLFCVAEIGQDGKEAEARCGGEFRSLSQASPVKWDRAYAYFRKEFCKGRAF